MCGRCRDGFAWDTAGFRDLERPAAVVIPKLAHRHARIQSEPAKTLEAFGCIGREVSLEEVRDALLLVTDALDGEHLRDQALLVDVRGQWTGFADVGEQASENDDAALGRREGLLGIAALDLTEDEVSVSGHALAVADGLRVLVEQAHAFDDERMHAIEVKTNVCTELPCTCDGVAATHPRDCNANGRGRRFRGLVLHSAGESTGSTSVSASGSGALGGSASARSRAAIARTSVRRSSAKSCVWSRWGK
jgi:hypothetical protein